MRLTTALLIALIFGVPGYAQKEAAAHYAHHGAALLPDTEVTPGDAASKRCSDRVRPRLCPARTERPIRRKAASLRSLRSSSRGSNGQRKTSADLLRS